MSHLLCKYQEPQIWSKPRPPPYANIDINIRGKRIWVSEISHRPTVVFDNCCTPDLVWDMSLTSHMSGWVCRLPQYKTKESKNINQIKSITWVQMIESTGVTSRVGVSSTRLVQVTWNNYTCMSSTHCLCQNRYVHIRSAEMGPPLQKGYLTV